jgi:hypothetical protein
LAKGIGQKMKKILLIIAFTSLAGCATVGAEKAPQKVQKIDRLSEEQLAQILPTPVSQLSFEALVAMSQEGLPAQAVIGQLKETDTAYDLTPSQMLDLNQKGVDIKVLDYLHESRMNTLRNKLTDVVSERDKKKNNQITLLKRELRFQSMMADPFCRSGFPRVYPYGINGRIRLGNPWYY